MAADEPMATGTAVDMTAAQSRSQDDEETTELPLVEFCTQLDDYTPTVSSTVFYKSTKGNTDEIGCLKTC